MAHKIARAGQTIQKELGSLISLRLKDPRIPDIVSVTHVDLANDLSIARVYVSTPGNEADRAIVVEALQSAAGKLSMELNSRIKIRRMPKLIFTADDTLERGEDMSDKIDRAIDEDRKLRTRREKN